MSNGVFHHTYERAAFELFADSEVRQARDAKARFGHADQWLLLVIVETLRKGGAPLLSPSQVETMATDQTPGVDLLPWPGRGFALGFTVLRDPAADDSSEPVGTRAINAQNYRAHVLGRVCR
ncbi:hypothetical protein DAMDJJ_08685 [Cupriavidus necator]